MSFSLGREHRGGGQGSLSRHEAAVLRTEARRPPQEEGDGSDTAGASGDTAPGSLSRREGSGVKGQKMSLPCLQAAFPRASEALES